LFTSPTMMSLLEMTEDDVAFSCTVACYSIVLIIVWVQIFKFKLYKQLRSIRCYIHISIMLSLITGILDSGSRLGLLGNPQTRAYAFCYIPSVFPLHFAGTAYSLALYHWASLSMPNKSLKHNAIVFVAYRLGELLIVLTSGALILRPTKR